MFVNICMVLTVSALVSAYASEDRANVEQTRETLAKWVETRQLLAKARGDWEADREVLQQTIKAFEKELTTVEEQFTKTGGGSAQVEKERAELLQQKESLHAANVRVKELLLSLETSLQKISNSLPSPLLSKIDVLLKRIPANPAETKMTVLERMQTVVGILSEVDKFNGAISVNAEIQKNAQGEEVQVKVLYLGLGQAYWVDKGGRAGSGFPGAQGWTWSENSALADRVARAIAIHEASQPADFVSLPATI
ncbi:MAG: DUF3450 family protein, partial [Limisphaerales bacterium]